jgi:CheY-like chemotaxis protein
MATAHPGQTAVKEILLVEDSKGDIILVQEALQECEVPVRLHVVENGFDAAAFLTRAGSYSDVPRPDLILLDINLPSKNGLELLADLKKNRELESIPVAVFTSSQSHHDIMKAYGLGASLFVTKPMGFYEFIKSIRSIISSLLRSDSPS